MPIILRHLLFSNYSQNNLPEPRGGLGHEGSRQAWGLVHRDRGRGVCMGHEGSGQGGWYMRDWGRGGGGWYMRDRGRGVGT